MGPSSAAPDAVAVDCQHGRGSNDGGKDRQHRCAKEHERRDADDSSDGRIVSDKVHARSDQDETDERAKRCLPPIGANHDLIHLDIVQPAAFWLCTGLRRADPEAR